MLVFRRRLGALALLALLPACSPQVPPQTVELSLAIGERITASEVSHEALVRELFDQSRGRIQDFLEYRWTPEFLANFTRDAELLSLLEDPTIGDDERGAIVLDFAEAAVVEIERKRRELLGPLDGLEAEALREIRASYADLRAMNVSVTGYLQSIHDLSEIQEDILDRLRLQRVRDAALDEVTALNRALEQAIAGAGEVEDVIGDIRDILDRHRAEPSPEE